MKIDPRGLAAADVLRLQEAVPDLEVEAGADWSLERSDGVWTLRKAHPPLRLCIDFDASGPDYRRKALRGGAEILARALGGLSSHRRVLDLSAGLGQDAVFMAQMGFEVTALERHPLLAFLLSEARGRTTREDLAGLRFQRADALDWLTRPPTTGQSFDVVYFDPMYPEKKKSALPRQEMRLFRELVGDDGDAAQVLELARRGPWRRVVVKRPLKAEELATGVRNRFEGHSVRYDVYVKET